MNPSHLIHSHSLANHFYEVRALSLSLLGASSIVAATGGVKVESYNGYFRMSL